MFKSINWKVFFILWIASLIGLVAIVPYSLALQGPDALAKAVAQTGMPVGLLMTVQLGYNAILFAVAILLGLSFAGSIGLGAPILEARLRGEAVWARLRSILPISIILGVLVGLLIIALEVFIFQPRMAALTGLATPKTTAWQGFLASFYGGIDEEILLRLCILSFFAWLGRFLSKTADGKPTLAVLWTANILAAVLFGLGHLPATAAILPITPLIVLRAIVLNGLGGIAFGYLYFTRGLESAMLSHFSADMVLHVLFAL